MRLSPLLVAFPALAAGSMAFLACGGGTTTSSTTTGTGGSTTATTTGAGGSTTTGTGGSTTGTGGSTTTTGTGGGTTTGTGGGAGTGGSPCGPAQPVSYDSCTGTPIIPDGTCLNGECATIPLETRVYDAWKAKTKAISGLTDAQLADRVKVTSITHQGGPDNVFVRIEYVVELDWVRSRQVDSPSLGNTPLVNAPSDAEIDSALTLAIETAEWTGLGAIAQVAPAGATQAGFDSCDCGMTIDFCHIDFENVSGRLQVKAKKVLNAGQNQCKAARVDVKDGALAACMDTPCGIN